MSEDPKPPTDARIRWLHLSDFHFKTDDSWDRRRTLKALLRFLADKKAEGWKPDFVFATGDIAWSGKEKEYEQAIFFFRELAKTLELDLPSQLFLIPGNHDVDRGAKGPADDFILNGLLRTAGPEQQELIAQALGHSATMRLLGNRLEQYYQFTERILGPARRTPNDKPWRVDFREVAGIEVAILQLNSAWASGQAEEKGRLLVGSRQLEEALSEAERSRIRFVLIHHPYDYLADSDAAAIKSSLLSSGSHFVLRGHLHATTVELSINPDGSLIKLAAGAVYAGAAWPKRFLIGEADLGKGRATIEFLTYSDQGEGFWTIDPLAYRNAKDGLVSVELPPDLKIQGLDADGRKKGGKGKKARQLTVISRYRTAVADVHGQMRFIGFPAAAAGHRPNVGVQELFVPLRLAVVGLETEKEKREVSTGELLAMLSTGKMKACRFVVLGEPGSGKTTLCKFAAVVCSGSTGSPPADFEKVLPLFLPFRDYVRRCREFGDCSLLEYMVDQARFHLQVGALDCEILEGALVKGNAVLFLDGLDEVGNEIERVQMRDRVVAFCNQYPKLSALLTSRYSGYDQAPLPKKAFQRLDLKPFEEDDLRIFVANWYSVQEPNDPIIRERGIADLLAAFATEPRVRTLAGNPLLATLIALVHRSEARLPGERAKLYELCVRTLLETWPWQSQRLFSDIDEGLQRAYLEEFALQQQEKRSSGAAEVSFDRDDLVATLTDFLGRVQSEANAINLRQIAERWVDHLAIGTGIIVEQRPGVFAFLHLSLLEYLAACAVDRHEESLENRIARLHREEVWQEVLLLAVGRHATDMSLLERLFIRLAKERHWFFLLLCLREEAAFDAGKLAAILDGAARALLAWWPYRWWEWEDVVRTVDRFSIRHGKPTREWRRKQLPQGLDQENAMATALMFGQPEEIRSNSNQLVGIGNTEGTLVEFWPGSGLKSWAVGSQAPSQVLSAFAKAPSELALVHAMASLEVGTPASIGAIIAIPGLRVAAHFLQLASDNASRLAELERRGGKGLPPRVKTAPLPLLLEVLPRWQSSVHQVKFDRVRYFLRGISGDLASEFSRDFVHYFAGEFNTESISQFIRHFVRDFTRDFAGELARYFAGDFDRYFERHFIGDFARDITKEIAGEGSEEIARDLARHFAGVYFDPEREVDTGPADISFKVDRRAFSNYAMRVKRGQLLHAAEAIATRRAAEAWIALATLSKSSREEAAAYVGHRLQNVALLYLWPALDRRLTLDPRPEKLALYLQLGWTQSTTTHEWPATERWISIMKAGPPAHWLPRAQWHLCWLLHDNQDAEHQRAFNEALREGLADTDLGRHAVAETLEQVIGFYP